MLEMGEFAKFIRELVETYNEERQDQYLWELFIHSPFYKGTFEEFKKERLKPQIEKPTISELKATVENSKQIIEIFKSQRGGE